jgi:hypothetical protein
MLSLLRYTRSEAFSFESEDKIMRHDSRPANDRRRPAGRLRRPGLIAAGLMAVGVLASACGGGASAGHAQDPLAQALAYTKCMRKHGVPSFPDPVQGPNGRISLGGLGLNSPQAISARQACRSLAPGGASTQTVSAVQQKAFLTWAACLRANGVPDFPDPTFDAGGPQFNVPSDANLDTLQSSENLCQHDLAGKWPGGIPIQIKHNS